MSDYDIRSDAVESASEFIQYDNKVITTGMQMLTIEIQHYAQGWKLILVDKNPIRDEAGDIIALFLTSIDVSAADPFRYISRCINKINALIK